MPWKPVNPETGEDKPPRIWDEDKKKYPKGNSAPPKIPAHPEYFYDPKASARGRIRQRSL